MNFFPLLYLIYFLRFCDAAVYTHTWAAHIEGGEDVAKSLAEKHGFIFLGTIMEDHYHLSHSHVAKRSIFPNEVHHKKLQSEPQVKWLEQQEVRRRVKRDNIGTLSFSDPKWPKMWYLNRGGGLDMNVEGAWEQGYKGKGVVVSILDDGIEKDHPDLRKNYDPKASYDVNNHDSDPQPRYDYTNENRHGTRCAGEVAAEANNGVCSTGVAYEASIGGVRMLDGDVTDAVEAQSLSLSPQHIDIYSASWGPDDDGRTVDGPAKMAQKAFKDGIDKGRGGKGSIFVWASGNGGRDMDSCNCDGYTNSIYTLSISSATESGHIPWYSEACSSTLSTTYSSGSGKEHQVITTDLRKSCTENHTGTSASAPLAAGICALALSANPNLTWRDLQHIVVMTSRPGNLKANDWVTNGVGRKVSHSFGFGLMDATGMVRLARNWTKVPEQHRCEIRSSDSQQPRPISLNGKVTVSLESHGCHGTNNEVRYLEHVQAVISLTATHRGQVQIYLTSPQGTKSTLLKRRTKDSSTDGFREWAFMTTHSWGEYSLGTWTLEVENVETASTLTSWSMVLYGTATDPLKGQSQQHPRPHSQDCTGDRLHILNAFCLDNCPVSFYAVNTTVPASTTAASSVSSSTTQTTSPSHPSETTTEAIKPSSTLSMSANNSTTTSIPGSTTTLPQPSVTPGVSPTTNATASPSNASQTTTYKLECLACAPGCAQCVGPSPGQCLECLEGYNKTVTGTCVYSPKSFPVTTTLVILALSFAAVATFFIVFGVLQMCEPDSCLRPKKKRYRPARTQGDVEAFSDGPPPSKISGLLNGVKYKNGSDAIRQPLLSSGSEDDLDS